MDVDKDMEGPKLSERWLRNWKTRYQIKKFTLHGEDEETRSSTIRLVRKKRVYSNVCADNGKKKTNVGKPSDQYTLIPFTQAIADT